MTIRIDGETLSIYITGSWTKIGTLNKRILTLKPESQILEFAENGYLFPYDFMNDPRFFDHVVFAEDDKNYLISRADIMEFSNIVKNENDSRTLFLSFEIINKIHIQHGI